jgi:soluble lytic murein transglycosylase-like protein
MKSTYAIHACLVLAVLLAREAVAEVYIYRGPDGEPVVSDRPMGPHDRGYELLSQRDSLANAGHILAGRRIDAGSMADFRRYIEGASGRHSIDPLLVEAIVQIESDFNAEAVSRKGASGLMQLMASTADQYNVTDRFDARQNVNAGVQYLAQLTTRFKGKIPLILAAYNAGPGAVERHGGIPPYPETRRYVQKVLSYYKVLKQKYTE